jgi:hypothetical protein
LANFSVTGSALPPAFHAPWQAPDALFLTVARQLPHAVERPADGAPRAAGKQSRDMDVDTVVHWLGQPTRISVALAGGLAPALIAAAFKRRAMIGWYLYGFVCTLVAWPLLAVPTIHVLLLRRRDMPRPSPRQRRRADALDLLKEDNTRSYPSWIAQLTQRRYAYENIGPGEALELVRESGRGSNDHAVAYCHRGVRVGYVPTRQRWIAEALDDGLCLAAVAVEVKMGWIARRRAKFVGTRILVLNGGRRR